MIDTSHYEECLEIMKKHKTHFTMRLILLLTALTFNFYAQVYAFVKMSNGFFMGMCTILLTLVVMVCGFFASPERQKIVVAIIVLLFLGTRTGLFHALIGWVLIFVFLAELPECRKAKWVMQQDGYPYFSVRFEEQKLHSEFRPLHKLDDAPDAAMPDLDDFRQNADHSVETAMQEMRQRLREREKAEKSGADTRNQYYIQPGESQDAMPGIAFRTPEEIAAGEAANLTAKPAETAFPVSHNPLPEPELPKAEAIPLPVWDTPEPSFPDPVTDTSVILSDFPDIAGDIPDLPELPDIPTI